MDKSKMNNGLWKKILVIALIVTILGVIFIMFEYNTFSRPFEDFCGPSYLPSGYNNTDNLTNDNERIFEYKGNGTFWAGVIKDTNQKQLKELLNPFEQDPKSVNKTSENLTVNGHTVVLQVSEKKFKMEGKNIAKILPANYTGAEIPEISLNMSKFQAKWYCTETKLTYVVTGLITSEQLPEMKKMIQSITCHQEKTIWNLLKFDNKYQK